jgi:hypothetical protein
MAERLWWAPSRSSPQGPRQPPPGSPGCQGQCRQHLAERGVNLEVGERVAAGRAPVDDRDWDPRLPGPVHEPQPGHHRQRGPEYEQTGGALDKIEAALHPGTRHVLAEEHDVRLEQIGAAALTSDQPEPRDLLLRKLDVSIGAERVLPSST